MNFSGHSWWMVFKVSIGTLAKGEKVLSFHSIGVNGQEEMQQTNKVRGKMLDLLRKYKFLWLNEGYFPMGFKKHSKISNWVTYLYHDYLFHFYNFYLDHILKNTKSCFFIWYCRFLNSWNFKQKFRLNNFPYIHLSKESCSQKAYEKFEHFPVWNSKCLYKISS